MKKRFFLLIHVLKNNKITFIMKSYYSMYPQIH